eukprot:SM000073S21500  [mRNA]  locus=s73:537505:538490:- [translate_table: standard]
MAPPPLPPPPPRAAGPGPAAWVQPRAAQAYVLLILLQAPMFRLPCRSGVCEAPLEVMVGQLLASRMVPVGVARALLFPGAVAGRIAAAAAESGSAGGRTGPLVLPRWDNVLESYGMANVTTAVSPPEYKYRIEVMAGSYAAVVGASLQLVKAQKVSVLGPLLIAWGLLKDHLFGLPLSLESAADGRPYPTLALLLAAALLSLRYDTARVRRLMPSIPVAAQAPHRPRPVASSGKRKLL